MNIGIVGTGYVGLVTGACLAEAGNSVICMDVDQDKIDALQAGRIPIYEPGLEELVHNNQRDGHLSFTTDIARLADACDVVFIAVGTPPGEDGSADLTQVLEVARAIGEHMTGDRLVVVKSTVPVGTCAAVKRAITTALGERGVDHGLQVASNPEFLKEGAAINDFMKPDRIIIGVDDDRAEERLRTLYQPFNRNHEKLVVMDVVSSEFSKYAANAMLASRISMMNEFAQIAERVGADIEQIRAGIGLDPRIGSHFIYAGIGFGGSCFPKDVRALRQTARELGYDARMLAAIENVNDDQKRHLLGVIDRHYGGDVSGKTFALWGLAFKPNTDDMREASSLVIIEGLLERGARIRAYDPVAADTARQALGERDGVEYVEDEYTALDQADALVIATEWKPFWSPDFARMSSLIGDRVVFDGRNIYRPEQLSAHGLVYHSIGRPGSARKDIAE